jgi:hypothetical protein
MFEARVPDLNTYILYHVIFTAVCAEIKNLSGYILHSHTSAWYGA